MKRTYPETIFARMSACGVGLAITHGCVLHSQEVPSAKSAYEVNGSKMGRNDRITLLRTEAEEFEANIRQERDRPCHGYAVH